MATIAMCAQLAEAIYEADPQVPGWTRVAFKPASHAIWSGSGFQGAAFRRDGEVVFVFKGTDSRKDAAADAKLALGMNTAQYNSAGNFLHRTLVPSNTPVALVGHSLGGAIAQIVGNRQGLPFVTFNAPGVALMSRNADEMGAATLGGTGFLRFGGSVLSALRHPGQALEDVRATFNTVRGVNFRLGMDLVGASGVHYGKVIELPYGGSAADVLKKHLISTVRAALEGSAFATMDLADVLAR